MKTCIARFSQHGRLACWKILPNKVYLVYAHRQKYWPFDVRPVRAFAETSDAEVFAMLGNDFVAANIDRTWMMKKVRAGAKPHFDPEYRGETFYGVEEIPFGAEVASPGR